MAKATRPSVDCGSYNTETNISFYFSVLSGTHRTFTGGTCVLEEYTNIYINIDSTIGVYYFCHESKYLGKNKFIVALFLLLITMQIASKC